MAAIQATCRSDDQMREMKMPGVAHPMARSSLISPEKRSKAALWREMNWSGSHSRWNAYVVTMQGSARLRLPNGHIMEVGYAGSTMATNMSAQGLNMVADGQIARTDLNFDAMRQYFDAHPQAMDTYLWANPRTVFFSEVHGGPIRLTERAGDKTREHRHGQSRLSAGDGGVFVRSVPPGDAAAAAMPSFVSRDGTSREFCGFVLDQDRGGAIRSAGRCDIYMGIGQSAEQTAGHQFNPGKLYYLAVKRELQGRYGG